MTKLTLEETIKKINSFFDEEEYWSNGLQAKIEQVIEQNWPTYSPQFEIMNKSRHNLKFSIFGSGMKQITVIRDGKNE